MVIFKRTDCNLCSSAEYKKLYEIKSKVPFTIVKCNSCGLIYMNPVVDQSSMQELYSQGYYHGESEHGFNFSNPLQNIEVTSLLYKERLERIKQVTGLNSGKLLDVGCTFGIFLYSVKDSGWELHGCDFSEYAVKMSKEKLNLDNVRLGKASEVGYSNEYFDVITLFEVIEHMDKPVDEMKEINKLLKKGGWVVIQTGNLSSLNAKIRGASNPYFLLGHLNYFSKKTLRRLLEETGFEVVRVETTMEKIEPAKMKAGKATLKDYWRLFYYKIFESLHLSGGMTFYARKK